MSKTLALFGMLISLAFVAVPHRPAKAIKTDEPATTNGTVRKHYTKEDILAYQTNVLVPLINQAANFTLPLPELNYRLKQQTEEIRKNYGRNVSVCYIQDNPENTAFASGLMGARVIDGSPVIGIFVQNMMANYEKTGGTNTDSSRQRHYVENVVGLMHELDHLCTKTLPEQDKPAEHFFENEKEAWALTCEKTLRPFVENNYPVLSIRKKLYDAWVASGRDVKSRVWDEAVGDLYRHVYAKVNRSTASISAPAKQE
jgi:hypothetical protein